MSFLFLSKEIYLNIYIYDGPVKSFGKTVSNRWISQTRAGSEAKARANLIYQYKKTNNIVVNCKIDLPGKMEVL